VGSRVTPPPNPRLQRTRSAPLRSPLSFQALGSVPKIGLGWIVLGLMAVACHAKSRTPEVFEIPHDYRGWIFVEFGVANCPPAGLRDGKLVFVIAPNGTACTSSQPEYGYAHDEFYLVREWKRFRISETAEAQRRMVWRGGLAGVGARSAERTFLHFFIGTEAQLKSAPTLTEALDKLLTSRRRA
jgi:hypothetical protein